MNFTKLFVSVCTALILLTTVSAAAVDLFVISAPANVTHNAGSFQVTLGLNYSSATTTNTIALTSSVSPGTVTFSTGNSVNVNNGVNQTIIATITYPANKQNTFAGTFTATPQSGGLVASTTSAISVPTLVARTFTINKVQELTKTQNGTFTITNTGNQIITPTFSNTGAFNVTYTPTTLGSIAPGATSSAVTVTPNPASPTLVFGTNTVTVKATDTGVNSTADFSLVEGFCPVGRQGINLSLTDVDVSNTGRGDDDEWQPLDVIKVEVDVENKGATDLDDVTVVLGLFDSTGKNVANKLDYTTKDEEEADVGDIRDGDEETATFEFKVPADFKTGNYKLVFKAYSDDISQSTVCTDTVAESLVENIQVREEDDEGKFIAFDNIVISPAQATCGDAVTVTFDAVNVGEDDEDKVKVNLFSKDLQVNQFSEITQGLDQGDSKLMSFSFQVPQVVDKTYYLEITADYDYRNGNYHKATDESAKNGLRVFGCAGTPVAGSSAITAQLASEAVAGKPLLVKATITNTGDKAGVFAVTASGFESWASLSDISDRLVQLDAGKSKEVTLTLQPTKSASGEKVFTLETRSDTGNVQSRQVAVTLAKATVFSGNNWVWVLAGINVVLVILIIVVAVVVSRR